MSVIRKHIVVFPLLVWSHTRPLVDFSIRLVKARPVRVTFLTTNSFWERVNAEFTKTLGQSDQTVASRILVVSIGDVIFNEPGVDVAFIEAWKVLIDRNELVCKRRGVSHRGLQKPAAILLDLFAHEPVRFIKSLNGNSVKVFAWELGMTACIFYPCGPPSVGGVGNIRAIAEEEARRTGRTYEEIVARIAGKVSEEVVKVPSLPPMYAYEHEPQGIEIPTDIAVKMFPGIYDTLEAIHGIFLCSPESYEPEAVAAVKQWFAQSGRPAYACGPLFPSALPSVTDDEKKFTGGSAEFQSFLDETLADSGERSLLYIAFGTMIWPANPNQNLWPILDVVMELGIPFILSHAAPQAVIPDDIQAKVKAYGRGLLSSWSPQQLVLNHPATGWFLGHGGYNGVLEAVTAGVPMILWPFTSDGPLNAIHITDTLRTGYELLEVRTALKPIYRTGYTPVGTIEAIQRETREVLRKAFGADGIEKRKRLEVLRRKVLLEWEDGGAAKREMSTFVDSL